MTTVGEAKAYNVAVFDDEQPIEFVPTTLQVMLDKAPDAFMFAVLVQVLLVQEYVTEPDAVNVNGELGQAVAVKGVITIFVPEDTETVTRLTATQPLAPVPLTV